MNLSMSGPQPISHFPVGKSVYTFIQAFAAETGQLNYNFFCHLLASTLIKLKEPLEERKSEIWVAIPAALFAEKRHRGSDSVNPEALMYLGLIEKLYSTRHQSFTDGSTDYKVADRILDEITPLLDVDDKEVDLFTGKPTKRASVLVKKNQKGVLEPVLIRDAIDSITECRFNWAAIKAVIRARKAEMVAANNTEGSRSYQGKYLNDYYCFKAVRRQQPVYLGQNIFGYRPPYRTQKTGRINHLWGGLQACSQEMKYAAYSGIPDLYNYKLSVSQGYILKQQYEAVGLDTSWLDTLIGDRGVSQAYARTLGIPEDDFQQAFYAAVLGSYYEVAERPSVYSVFSWTFASHPDINKALNQFLSIIAPLQLDQWHKLLVIEYYTVTGYKHKGKRYLYNPTGKRISIDNIPPTDQPRELAAFVLQGQEAAFNHWICLLGLKYGYQVMSHEHDGVVTLGAIPRQAVEEAQVRSGLKYGLFEKQEFLPDLTQVHEWLGKYHS